MKAAMVDNIKEILVDVYRIDGSLESEAAERIAQLFNDKLRRELLLAFMRHLKRQGTLTSTQYEIKLVDKYLMKNKF